MLLSGDETVNCTETSLTFNSACVPTGSQERIYCDEGVLQILKSALTHVTLHFSESERKWQPLLRFRSQPQLTDLSLLRHPPQVGIPSGLVAHLPAPTAYITERQRGLLGIFQWDLQRDRDSM